MVELISLPDFYRQILNLEIFDNPKSHICLIIHFRKLKWLLTFSFCLIRITMLCVFVCQHVIKCIFTCVGLQSCSAIYTCKQVQPECLLLCGGKEMCIVSFVEMCVVSLHRSMTWCNRCNQLCETKGRNFSFVSKTWKSVFGFCSDWNSVIRLGVRLGY